MNSIKLEDTFNKKIDNFLNQNWNSNDDFLNVLKQQNNLQYFDNIYSIEPKKKNNSEQYKKLTKLDKFFIYNQSKFLLNSYIDDICFLPFYIDRNFLYICFDIIVIIYEINIEQDLLPIIKSKAQKNKKKFKFLFNCLNNECKFEETEYVTIIFKNKNKKEQYFIFFNHKNDEIILQNYYCKTNNNIYEYKETIKTCVYSKQFKSIVINNDIYLTSAITNCQKLNYQTTEEENNEKPKNYYNYENYYLLCLNYTNAIKNMYVNIFYNKKNFLIDDENDEKYISNLLTNEELKPKNIPDEKEEDAYKNFLNRMILDFKTEKYKKYIGHYIILNLKDLKYFIKNKPVIYKIENNYLLGKNKINLIINNNDFNYDLQNFKVNVFENENKNVNCLNFKPFNRYLFGFSKIEEIETKIN
jgi:hypothetical protein